MKLTTAQRKLIASLTSARQRRETGLFVAEGIRSLRELLPSFGLRYVVATSAWLEEHEGELRSMVNGALRDDVLLVAKNDEMARMSSMSTPQGVLAVMELPQPVGMPDVQSGELVLALDRIQDPGNLGTIIRVADWFGIHKILASMETADCFNPKVVQSTMGALARVEVLYCNLERTLGELAAKEVPIYGTFLDGQNLYETPLSAWGVIVMGNEGNGISPEVGQLVNRRIKIPSFPPDAATVESLNVGTATAVTVAEFRRRAL
jgi:TrmH family RNA methyltransferase